MSGKQENAEAILEDLTGIIAREDALTIMRGYILTPRETYRLTTEEVDRIKADAWDQGAREGDLAQYSGRALVPNPYRDTP